MDKGKLGAEKVTYLAVSTNQRLKHALSAVTNAFTRLGMLKAAILTLQVCQQRNNAVTGRLNP